MASFDFVEAATHGYQYTWTHRKMLVRFALFPVLVKLVFFVAIALLGLEESYLRQGLLLLPVYFIEGWLIAHIIRMAALGEPWSNPLTGNAEKDEAVAESRKNIILGATLTYVLIKIVQAFFSGVLLSEVELQQPQEPAEPSAAMFFGALVAMAFLIWAFRLIWLYIPVALGVSMKRFLVRIQSFMTSFYMLGMWLLCFVPMIVVMLVLSEMALSIFPNGEDGPTRPYVLLMALVRAPIETALAVISSIGMAHGIRQILDDKTQTPDDLL